MTRRLAPNGESAELEDVDIVSASGEEWMEYELSDGTTLRAKSILSSVRKAIDENGESIYDSEGEPYYQVRFDSAIDVNSIEGSDD